MPCGCPDPTVCDYPCASGSSAMAFSATCSNGTWNVASAACPDTPPPVQCGGTTCAAGQVCVREGNDVIGCAADPCPANLYDCSCLHTACPADHPICTATDGPNVNCQ
jgi:hypothetical protein